MAHSQENPLIAEGVGTKTAPLPAVERLLTVVLIRGFRTIRWALSLIPPHVFLWLTRGVAVGASPFIRRERRVAEAQIEFARRAAAAFPKRTSAVERAATETLWERAPREIFVSSLRHFGEMIGELFILKRLLQRGADSRARDGLPDFPHIDSTGAAIVRRYLDARSPIVALSGHLGNFELLAAYYAACGAGISVVGRSANYAPLNALIDELRRSYGVENIERANASSVSALRRALSEKRTLAVLIDQDTDLQSGFSPFFTLEAATPTAPIRLAIRQRLPILSTFIVRTGPLKHLIVTEEIEYNPDSPDAIQHILDTYSERLEALLSLFPEQWPWWHRRWRRRPGVDYRKESPRTTKKYIEWIQTQAEPRQ